MTMIRRDSGACFKWRSIEAVERPSSVMLPVHGRAVRGLNYADNYRVIGDRPKHRVLPIARVLGDIGRYAVAISLQ